MSDLVRYSVTTWPVFSRVLVLCAEMLGSLSLSMLVAASSQPPSKWSTIREALNAWEAISFDKKYVSTAASIAMWSNPHAAHTCIAGSRSRLGQ